MPSQGKSLSTAGIVGFGAFGALIARHLAGHCRVLAFDPAPREAHGLPVTFCDLATVARCDVLILAVPVNALAEAIRALSPHLRPGTIVVDVGSVKIEPVRIMREELPPFVEIIGTHPLFGPQSAKDGVAGHRIAWCPVRGRAGGRIGRIAAFLRRVLRLQVIRTTPDAHDREMAVVQGLTHLIGKLIVSMEPMPGRMATRSFELILQATDMVRHDAPTVYEAIERANPHAAAVRERFFRLADEVRSTLDGRRATPVPAAVPAAGPEPIPAAPVSPLSAAAY